MTRINRRTKALKHFAGYTHEDIYGALRILVGYRRSRMTQKEAADAMGVSVPIVSRLENADSRVERTPTLGQLQAYAHAIGAELRLAVITPERS